MKALKDELVDASIYHSAVASMLQVSLLEARQRTDEFSVLAGAF